MAIGTGGRVVDPALKHELHVALREDGKNLKDWLIENANMYLQARQQPSLALFDEGVTVEARQ
ncbi:MAG: hypothetical protein HON27_17835 [Candidatus Marinimicrobia bacterium]|jgi:hypothetical protein|nr:hypothetical protein [Candidatus Neomarinimicrobiota bacterium]MBT4948010.1 hypothetical protein [Candidatus Neomarinimicrobiota bacterium]MBT5269788.1 hypothetical protein [Candidatus Neomarinimicrobiota bacterium]